ncbi:uncharacterized protein G6M90_00g064590 [Metarhizium brunneum]|uniref:Zn(2)-C6 fungal-type domain-containing protein n=1 Tax=Metarhizium brunneum TaxID=500148 RepID=A0A7D5YUF8_9HYPO|nr:hypothetical protein G6M90_00g064590 [Metarhizium brunneum]
MSLAKRNDGKGCYECRMRRVRCDKTEPECFKCQKKGIKCSGQGIECRFSKHMNRKQTPSLGSPQLPATSSKASKSYLFVNVENTHDGALPTSSGQPGASTTGPSISTFIASKMVVLDFNENGYRQIVLPIACQDDLVAQAVSVIAAFHLSSRMPSMHMAAERGQELILSRLRQQSLNLGPGQLFNMSTLATLLVLLVGDTITGANNYVYLLELLSRLAKLAMNDPRLSDTTKAFIMEQTKMFQLFGFPLSSQMKGIQTFTKSPDYYLDFMTSSPSLGSDPEQYANIQVMKDIIRQACYIYRNRASHEATRESSIEAVERLRQTVTHLDPNVEGRHALVWAFFVASAESILPEHRDFFYNRLKGLFECTRFGSIPLALQTLDYIWSKQDSTNWIEIVTHERQILIM